MRMKASHHFPCRRFKKLMPVQQSASPSFVCLLADVVDVQRVDLKPFCIEIETKDKLVYLALRSDEEVYGWMEDVYSRSPLMGVSQPTNFVHQVHVGFDPVSGGFTVRLRGSREEPEVDVRHRVYLLNGASC